jgi:hypothetical protein
MFVSRHTYAALPLTPSLATAPTFRRLQSLCKAATIPFHVLWYNLRKPVRRPRRYPNR